MKKTLVANKPFNPAEHGRGKCNCCWTTEELNANMMTRFAVDRARTTKRAADALARRVAGIKIPRRKLPPLKVKQIINAPDGTIYRLEEKIDSSYHNFGRTSWVWSVSKKMPNGNWRRFKIFNESTIKNWANPRGSK